MAAPRPRPRRLLVLALAQALLAMAAAGRAEAQSACPPAERIPTIVLNTLPGRVSYSRELDVEGLANLRRRDGQRATGRGAAVGLTDARMGLRIGVAASQRVESAGLDPGCAYLTSVKATLGYETIQVYLARDYPPESCAYKVIRDHEDRHVARFRENLAEFSQIMRSHLVAEASRLGPIRASDPKSAGETFQKQLWQKLQPILKDMTTSLRRNQMAMDTPQAYAAEQARCTDW